MSWLKLQTLQTVPVTSVEDITRDILLERALWPIIDCNTIAVWFKHYLTVQGDHLVGALDGTSELMELSGIKLNIFMKFHLGSVTGHCCT